MPTFDTSPLKPAEKRESAGVFAPGPIAGLADMTAPKSLLSPAHAFIAQFDRIAKHAKDEDPATSYDKSFLRGQFHLLLDMLATIHLRSGHQKLIDSIRTTYPTLDIPSESGRVTAAIANLSRQRF